MNRMIIDGLAFALPLFINVSYTHLCEAVAANHMGMKICGISCVSNQAADAAKQPLTHEEVQEMADRKAPMFKKLITSSIVNIAKEIL